MRDPILPVFRSILCATHNGAAGVVARHQARWLAGEDAAVTLVPPRALTRCDPASLAGACRGHDLVVVAAEPETQALLPRLEIPVLVARWCPHGGDFTDEILLAIGDCAGTERAAELAAAIALRHRGDVTIVGAPGHAQDVRRGLASGERLLHAAGVPPRLLAPVAGHAAPERVVPAAAAETGASLLVVGVGEGTWDAPLAHDIARRSGCSVLIVPALVPSVVPTDPDAEALSMPAAPARATITV